jgi:SUN domain-containing protein 1/2
MATPRRSTRVASGARSIASQSAYSAVVVTQDTPNRGPGRQRALPKVKARQSTAYGASGRMGAAQELTVPQTGFAEAFQTQRGAAIAKDAEEQSARSARSSPAARTSSRRSERGTPSQMDYESEDPPSEQEEESESEDEEDISAETSKSFGMNHEAGMLRGPTPNQTPARRDRTATPGASISVATNSVTTTSVATSSLRPAPERRIPPIRPSNALLSENLTQQPVREPAAVGATPRFPIARPAQEAAASGVTPRVPTTKPVQDPSATPRAPPVRPDLGSRIGGFTPRVPADRPAPAVVGSGLRAPPLRPAQTANGAPIAQRPIPPRAVPVPEAEPEVEPAPALGIPLLDRIRAKISVFPWRYFAVAALAALLAFAAGLAAKNPPSYSLPTQFSNGWKSFTGRLSPGSWIPTAPLDNSSLKTRVDDVELNLKDIQSYIHSLGNEIPDYVVVSRSPSGTINVPKQFWDAIISRIRKEGPSIEWDTFVQHNEEKLRSAIGTEATVLRKDLFRAIDSNFNEIAADFDKKLEAHTRILLKDAEKVASKEARKAVTEHARIRSMALSSLIANVELQYGKPNYFSTGLGANPISGITSPTLSPTKALFERVWHRVVAPRINPPLTALQTWDEPGDCWCAAPDESHTGKAQLGIELGEPILPTQLTIEHLPRSSAPSEDISSAPQDVELWVKSDEPALVRFAFDGERCEDGPEGWQCLGKVRYDRNAANHVQTFLLDGEAQTPVNKVMLRVTSNWGAAHTCLYRVRLHGKGLRPVPENESSL